MNKKISVLLLLVILVLPAFASAQTIQGIVGNVARAVYQVGVGIVVIMWIVTGILFLTAVGNTGKLTTARNALLASVGGTAIILLANVAINIVGNALGS